MRVAAALAVLLASSSASAFAPRKGDGGGTRREVTAATPMRARAAFAPLAQRGWRATWSNGVPLRMWGGTVDAPGAVGDAVIAEREARRFLAAHLSLLAPGAAASDFVVVANQLDGGLRTVGFAQRWRGLRVIGGQLGFVFGRGGGSDRLFAIGSEAVPEISASLPATRANAAALRARTTAWLWKETGLAASVRAVGERAVLRTAAGDRVVEIVDVAADASPERWDVYVGTDGVPLARKSRVMFATGTLEYNAGVRYGRGARDDFAASAATITVNAAGATTAANGGFSWTGTTAATVITGLTGTYARVVNQAGDPASATLTVQPGQTGVWDLATDELGDAQVSTYVCRATRRRPG